MEQLYDVSSTKHGSTDPKVRNGASPSSRMNAVCISTYNVFVQTFSSRCLRTLSGEAECDKRTIVNHHR
jgi:hypothetical protein